MHFLAQACTKIISSNTCLTPFQRLRISTSCISEAKQLLVLLNQITNLKQFNQIHAHITTSGLQHNQVLIGKLVEISAIKFNQNNNNMAHPMSIFTHAKHRNQFTWNTIIRGFSIGQTPLRALDVFVEMCRNSIEPESFTFAFVFKACARSRALETGKLIHAFAMKNGNGSHLFVANTAICLYSTCGDLGSAQKLFDEMGHPNVVSWNAVISGYVQNGRPDDGLRIFDLMWSEGIKPDDITMINVLSACSQKKQLELGKWVHAYVDDNCTEFESNVYVGTAIIDMYAKCKQIESARVVFNAMQGRDIGVWNAMIGGYVVNQCFKEAIDLFQELEANRLDPDESTLVSILCACAHLCALDIGKKVHSYAKQRHFILNVSLGTAFIDMYSKCGCISEAQEVFSKMQEHDVMTWTSMIGGLAVHGHARDAINLFMLMLDTGPEPDGITFLCVLCACSHAGLVDEGLHYFESMRYKYNITPTIEHYGCMIDLLGRLGRLDEAHKMICSVEILPNPIVWRALLSTCKLHSNVKLAEVAVVNLFKLQSDSCGDYVLLSNIYASNGRWDDVENIRRKLEEGGLRKIPGLSSAEADNVPSMETWMELSKNLYKQSKNGQPLNLELMGEIFDHRYKLTGKMTKDK